jgi:hypothetical protein
VKTGERHTRASRQKMSLSHLGRVVSAETRGRMSAAQLRRRERERMDPQARRLRLLCESARLEAQADRLREQQVRDDA